jgi:hypothetical protein
MFFRAAAIFVAVLSLAVSEREARACGNVTHAWISIDAKARLPQGPIRELLDRPGMERYLRNGTMFPDGGYPIGDDYGEMAHWEPFQDRYLAWIREHYQPPWSDEAAMHIAFLLGMASHGMADQVYDSTFMEGSKHAKDPGWETCHEFGCDFDSTTDILWARLKGPGVDPERWFPDAFPDLFHQAGHDVTVETMTRGANLVGNAISAVRRARRTTRGRSRASRCRSAARPRALRPSWRRTGRPSGPGSTAARGPARR